MALCKSVPLPDSDVAAAAQCARQALEPFLESPSVVLDLSSTNTSADENAGLACTEVHLVASPYERRRPTIEFVPYDTPAAGDECHRRRKETEGDDSGTPVYVLVQPEKLPLGDSEGGGPGCTLFKDAHSQRRIVARAPGGPYSRLSYVMDDSCKPFTALLSTLRVAGFTRVSGRAALLHKTHSLLWVKHLLPSMVDQLLERQTGAYRKVNHFPGTHALGRKDKLCLLLRRAGLRWRASGELSATLTGAGNNNNDSTAAARAMAWESLTPESWLLPQDAEACAHALRQPNPSGSAAPLFIVKPTNQAGGQGIFLIYGGGENGVTALMAAVGGLSNGLGSASRKGSTTTSSAAPLASLPGTASRQERLAGSCSSDSAASYTAETTRNHYIVQRYMENPFLLDGRKFDLRLYVVVTSYDPVRLYLYREGLVRIASSPYTRTSGTAGAAGVTELADATDLRAHLTNFTVNKGTSPASAAERDAGATAAVAATGEQDLKWSLSSLAAYLAAMGYDWPGTLKQIHELLRLVFLSVTPDVRAALRASSARRLRCSGNNEALSSPSSPAVSSHATVHGTSPFFEIFGVDVLLIRKESESKLPHDSQIVPTCVRTLRPVLLEVNIMPSLSTHYSLFDQRIKANFIADALTLVGLMPPPCKAASAAAAAAAPSAPHTVRGQRVSYNDVFLDELGDIEALNVCLATEEEHRRAHNFARLLPTPDSASKYGALMETTEENGTSTATPSRLDAVLSAWLACSPSRLP
ncbi:hypothetical protein JKF63_05946 [Porcisia hertigi]|uniref:Tubulin--tyrosine ligase-like protein 5 n=1 Tax=Porcisia hertigi TaxID=2761500 RepID=A0A836IX72_9TRYP|nr:hypothetical protein JKF63_05946 [Porcisia hertigi]